MDDEKGVWISQGITQTDAWGEATAAQSVVLIDLLLEACEQVNPWCLTIPISALVLIHGGKITRQEIIGAFKHWSRCGFLKVEREAVQDDERYTVEFMNTGLFLFEGKAPPIKRKMAAVSMLESLQIYFPHASGALITALKDWADMRKAKRKPITGRAWELNIKKLHTLTGGREREAVETVERSTASGWTSFYPLWTENGIGVKPRRDDTDWSDVTGW